MATVGEFIVSRAADDRRAVVFEDASWSWRQLAAEASARAALLRRHPATGPAHVGILLDNVPEFMFWLAAAGISRSVIVGINPTRRGAESSATSGPPTAGGSSPTPSTSPSWRGSTSGFHRAPAGRRRRRVRRHDPPA